MDDSCKALVIIHKFCAAKDEWIDISVMAMQRTAEGPVVNGYLTTPLTSADLKHDIDDHIHDMKWGTGLKEREQPSTVTSKKTRKTKQANISIWLDSFPEDIRRPPEKLETDMTLMLYSLSDLFLE